MSPRRRALALLFALLSVAGCERKLPGPRECEVFAVQALGITSPAVLERPQVRDAVDALTVRCLTTPFDRALLRCVEEGGGSRACFAQFGPSARGDLQPGEHDDRRPIRGVPGLDF